MAQHPLLAQTDGPLTLAVRGCLPLKFSIKNLRSVVYNLLSNAFKCHACRTVRVHLSCACEGHLLRRRVQGNGMGLTAAQQTRFSGLVQRLHTYVEGTGVGLRLIRKMVGNGGGSAVESQANVSAAFTVFLPVWVT